MSDDLGVSNVKDQSKTVSIFVKTTPLSATQNLSLYRKECLDHGNAQAI